MTPFSTPQLPYAFDALEPHIDARTMEIHHARHHDAYVKNLNAALEGYPALQSASLEHLLRNLAELPESVRAPIRNHGGGHANHTLFWRVMTPGGNGEPVGRLGEALADAFGGFEAFKAAFTRAAMGRFGSGWAWLTVDASGALEVTDTPNQDSPLMHGLTPILGLDVWEHAYYLAYQNRRAEYIEAWWSVVDWEEVARRHASATDAAASALGPGGNGAGPGPGRPTPLNLAPLRARHPHY